MPLREDGGVDRPARAIVKRLIAAAAVAGSAWACSRPTQDVEPQAQVGAREITLVGEVHGTEEAPAEFGNMVERLARERHPVNVGVELPSAALDAPCGGAVPEESYWKRPMQDGRTSRSMLRLICRMKDLERSGRIRLFGIVPEGPPPDGRHPYYEAIARELDRPAARTLVLLGNFHSRRAPGGLVQMLEQAGAKVTALTVSSPAVSAWNCRGAESCGSGSMMANFCGVEAAGPAVVLGETARMGPAPKWDGCLVFPSLSASPPA